MKKKRAKREKLPKLWLMIELFFGAFTEGGKKIERKKSISIFAQDMCGFSPVRRMCVHILYAVCAYIIFNVRQCF